MQGFWAYYKYHILIKTGENKSNLVNIDFRFGKKVYNQPCPQKTASKNK